MKAEKFREFFPALRENRVNGCPMVWFDNAATSQRPSAFLDRLRDLSVSANANVHRAVHELSSRSTDAYEATRDRVTSYLNASCREEIIFTYGTTSGINLVASSFGEAFIHEGDEIIVGEAEHHSNMVPWQLVAKRKGARVVYLPMGDDGLYDLTSLDSLLTPRTRIACFAHASNVLGIVNPVREMVEVCHSHGVPVLVDGAQGAVHKKVDVRLLDCDFYVFSAHKMFGPTGVGVLYGRKSLLEQMPPFLSGGEMISEVSLEGASFAELPFKFEAGTPNFTGISALSDAVELMDNALNDSELCEELEDTKEWLCQTLAGIDGLTFYGAPGTVPMECKLPIFSFTVDGAHHTDLATLLDRMGVEVRSGHMCAEPLMHHFGITGMLRASLLPYNTRGEAEYFVESLKRAIRMLK